MEKLRYSRGEIGVIVKQGKKNCVAENLALIRSEEDAGSSRIKGPKEMHHTHKHTHTPS